VSEQNLNGTSAQLGYTVPLTLVHAGKYVTEDKLKTDTLQKLNTTQEKQTTRAAVVRHRPDACHRHDSDM